MPLELNCTGKKKRNKTVKAIKSSLDNIPMSWYVLLYKLLGTIRLEDYLKSQEIFTCHVLFASTAFLSQGVSIFNTQSSVQDKVFSNLCEMFRTSLFFMPPLLFRQNKSDCSPLMTVEQP